MPSSPSAQAKSEFAEIVLAAVKFGFEGVEIGIDDVSASISIPKSEMGDLCTSIAFRLGKMMKKSPREVAIHISTNAKPTRLLKNFSEANGYVNAVLDEKEYSKLVLQQVIAEKECYGASDSGKGKKVIVEFPSVNPNKPWHVGHVRNAVLGASISNILKFVSFNVEREDYIDDLGLQMAESLWGWMNISSKPDKKFDQWMGEQYVLVNKEMEKQNMKKDLDLILKKLENLDSEESRTVRELAERCVRAQLETAMAYGVYHDVMIWESDIVRAKLLEKALKLADMKGILDKPTDGKYAHSTVVKMHKIARFAKELIGNEEEAKVIVRSNGAATYIAKDFAFHSWKFGLIDSAFRYSKFIDQDNGKPLYFTSKSGEEMEFGKVDLAINIIDVRQKYEQQIMKAMFSLIGEEKIAEGIIHFAYGRVTIKGSDLSTRSGSWMGDGKNFTADDLLREAKEVAHKIVSQSESISDKSSFDSISNSVALAAIKFEFLKFAAESEIVFSWDKALTFEGDSGPYCSYTHARATRVLEKGAFEIPKSVDADKVERGADFELIKLIGSFNEMVEKAAREYRPNVITDYLLNLSSLFSKFYEKMPIITGGESKEVRLAITYCAKQTLGNALRLIGIEPLERM
ncbi:MAG: arginine--tRNA ligase [Candidatus Micrarchaeota archaeon]|nr:arginine--tRNA ligase [Candidatus Micrarchaeota archaeon]